MENGPVIRKAAPEVRGQQQSDLLCLFVSLFLALKIGELIGGNELQVCEGDSRSRKVGRLRPATCREKKELQTSWEGNISRS